MSDLAAVANSVKAWPFVEARRLLERHRHGDTPLVFQTGYGPSGLPHIGTFCEVARTTLIRHAYEELSGEKARLICFSDDLDGFRKVPANVPQQEELRQDIGLPLTSVRDPHGVYDSFAAHNNARLRHFLDDFGFDYEFHSATECYRSGRFDEMLTRLLERFDAVMEIMLPTLGGLSRERRTTYSPFLPISPKTGHVLQVPTLERNLTRGTIIYREPDGESVEVPVTGGHVKLQWKPDWAMRWAALGVDYEMYGKDLIPSAALATRICRALGATEPVGMRCELFLDESGRKISKSSGVEGVSVEDWLRYGSRESLFFFMYQKPQTAKRLHIDSVPKAVDEYHGQLRNYVEQEANARLANPVWHIHRGAPPPTTLPLSFAMLINLAAAAATDDEAVLWRLISRYAPDLDRHDYPDLTAAVAGACRYVRDRVIPTRQPRAANDTERAALTELKDRLDTWSGEADADALQSLLYALGKAHGFDPLRQWFQTLYEVLFGTSDGPRLGSFIAVYGVPETAAFIARRLQS